MPSEKRAILAGQLAFLYVSISIFFTVSDIITGYTESFLLYILLTVIGSIAYFLNRFQLHSASKIILMLGANFIIFMAYEAEGAVTGSYAFFITCIVGSFAIFGYEKRNTALLLSFFSVLLYFLATSFDFNWVPKANFDLEDQKMYFMINFIIALLTSILMILFLIKLNHASESRLIKTSKELVSNRLRFELAIRGSSVGIWDWDALNDDLFLSPLLVRQLGYPAEKYENMTSAKLDRVVHPADLPALKLGLKHHLEYKEKFYHEFRLRKGDNSYYWVLVSGQAQWNESGQPMKMVGTVVDINDLKEATSKQEEQNQLLEKANDELDRFVYSTSHDLRAPLSSILGLVHIAEQSKDPQELAQCLSMINGRVKAMNDFIEDIISYSRNTRLDVIEDQVNLKELVNELIEGLRYFEQSEKVNFVVEIPNSLVLFSDKSRLKIILNNLISNAIKYHNYDLDKPFIKIKAGLEVDQVVISVEDNGTGIAKELQPNIFDMFYRATQTSQGSGLGLYIAKEMASKISSSLTMQSEVGKGSVFTLEIPFEEVIKDSAA